MKNKKAQVWIETVLYTLVGLALIGIVLAIATPSINKARDRIVVEQTIDSLNRIDGKISDLLDDGADNIRTIDLTMKRGELFFDSASDEITIVIDELKEPFSEPGVEVPFGNILLLSEEGQKTSKVSLTLEYGNIADLKFDGAENLQKFNSASTPYTFSARNLGDNDGDGIAELNIDETSGA